MTPSEVLSAFKSGTRDERERAYRMLLAHVKRCRHPAIARAHDLGGSGAQERLEEIANDYFIYLLTEREKWNAAKIDTWSGMRRDIQQWLGARDKESEDATRPETRHFKHLLEKTRSVLKHDLFEVRSNRGVKRYALSGREASRCNLTTEEVVTNLPMIGAKLQSSDDRQPEIASRDDIMAQLRRLFEMNGNQQCTLTELTSIVFDTLDPKVTRWLKPAPEHEDGSEREVQGPEDLFQQAHISSLAAELDRALPDHLRRAAAVRYVHCDRPRPLREVAAALGVSTSTAGEWVGDTNSALALAIRSFATPFALEPEEVLLLLQAWLEILSGSTFSEEPMLIR